MERTQKKLLEKDLYPPVKTYLEGLGYAVKGEVADCDIAAVRGEELLVVELKRGFTMELLYQAIRRQSAADSVYVAVPLPRGGYRAPRYHDMLRLCSRLELGLIFVGFTASGKGQVDVALHPADAGPVRKNSGKRRAILSEHAGRTGSRNTGGVTRRKILTVYKEQCLQIARLLARGEMTPVQIKAAGGPEKAGDMMRKNFNGWFCRTEGRAYALTEAGRAALAEYADLLEEEEI